MTLTLRTGNNIEMLFKDDSLNNKAKEAFKKNQQTKQPKTKSAAIPECSGERTGVTPI